MKRLIKALSILFYLACALVLAWILISWIDVGAHNMTTGSYWNYNFFTMLLGIQGGNT